MNTLTLRRMTQIDEQTDLAELGRRAAAELKYTYLMSWTHRPLLHVLISLRIFPFLEAESYFIPVWNEPAFTDVPVSEQVELPAP
jgi:hypothetical protein